MATLPGPLQVIMFVVEHFNVTLVMILSFCFCRQYLLLSKMQFYAVAESIFIRFLLDFFIRFLLAA